MKTDLNTVERKNQSINEYTLKIKNICENLASINASVDNDDKIGVCLWGLGSQYKSFTTSIRTTENLPSFADLVSMLIMEEKSMGERSLQSNKNSEQHVFYLNTSRGCQQGHDRGGYGGGQSRNQQQNQDSDNY